MEAIKDFEDFYRVKIEPQLPDFKAAGKIIEQWRIAAIVSGIIFIGALAGYVFDIITEAAFSLILLSGTVLAISVYKYFKKDNNYVDDFKHRIVQEVIDHLHAGLVYKPDELIAEKEYRQSGLFRRNYDYYEGDDFIEGIYKGVGFHCSELHTQYDSYSRRNRVITIFKGLFFAARANSGYTGGTYVWIKGEEQLGASIADEAYRLIHFPEVREIKMGHAIFDTYYTVCSTNPAEAREILNEELMNNLLRFRKQVHRKVVFSVVMGRCYVAIPIDEDIFEPADEPDDKEAIKKYFFGVLLVLSIINQLNLGRLQ